MNNHDFSTTSYNIIYNDVNVDPTVDPTDFRATETQKLIVAEAFEAVTDIKLDPQNPLLADMSRMMVVIQGGRMDSYFRQGFEWSMRSRASREPEQVLCERLVLYNAVERFHFGIENARGEGARRIRGNRARRLKAQQAELNRSEYFELLGWH